MSEQTKINWRELEIGGLWKKKGEDGVVKSLSGRLLIGDKQVSVMVFPNRFLEEHPTGPDFRVYLAPESDKVVKSVENPQANKKPATKPVTKTPVATKPATQEELENIL